MEGIGEICVEHGVLFYTDATASLGGNEFLADAASQYAADVRIIPSCVEVEDYVHRSSRPAAAIG